MSQPGFRSKSIVVVTTFLDPLEMTKEDLAFLYRARWNNELDLRSIKITLQMDEMRCKTPELVRKEIWTHILAYNLIRTIMAQAATKHDLLPRTISFKSALQTLEAFQPMISMNGAGITQESVSDDPRCNCNASRWRPPQSIRTTPNKTTTEEIRLSLQTKERHQT